MFAKHSLKSLASRLAPACPVRTGRVARRFRPGLEMLEDLCLLSSGLSLSSGYGQIPLSFEVNQGQTNAQVDYLAHGQGYGIFLSKTDAVLSLTNGSGGSNAIDMHLVGDNSAAAAIGLDKQSGVSNYLIGDASQWHVGIANYGQVEYQQVYPGIDVVYYGNQQQLEYDFHVAPGADPDTIQLAFEGATGVQIDDQGQLLVHTSGGDITWSAPVLYQETAAGRQVVSGQFVVTGPNQVGFAVGAYNPSLPLVIDPTLVYSTYLGGNNGTYGDGIAVDAAGHAYVVGATTASNFPTTPGAFQTSYPGIYSAFVTELNATGTGLVYSTYLGGNGATNGGAIAVDAAGHAYVTGFTQATNFPTTPGAFQTANHTGGGNGPAFVTELNPTGTGLVYSTYLGGNLSTTGYGIAVDAAGHAYVVGQTDASNFPTTAGAVQTSFSGNPSAFVTELNPTGTALVYSTYLGGNASTYGSAIALDAAGDAYVTGYTQASNFPTTPGAFQTTNPAGAGDNAAIVTELNPSGTALVYSTYLGGNPVTYGNGIAVDAAGDAYVVGNTNASNFPTTPGAFQTSFSGNGSVIVTKLNPTGTGLVYSTYVGGDSYGFAIAVDAAGDAYVTGNTSAGNFPTTAGAFQTTNLAGAANASAIVTELNPTGTGLVYSTYLSGTSSAYGYGIAVDAAGQIYVMGTDYGTNFPTTPGAFQTSLSGNNSAFVARFDDTTTTTLTSSTNPVVYGQPFTVTATVAAVDALDDGTPSGGTVTFTVNGVTQTPVALNQGVATLTLSNLTTGMDTIGASYSGSTPYDGSAATSLTETGTAATANQLVFGQQPTNTTAGAVLSPAVTVMIEDQYGNLVTADNTDQVTVAVATGPGGFSSSSTTTVTASGGITTFSNLVLNVLGSYTLSESASGALTGPASSSFAVNVKATSLAFGVQPANTAAGAAINPAVTVQILDQFGHVFSTDNTDQVTVAVAGGPGGFSGGSSTTATVSNGVATFSNLHLNTVGTYALSETASSSLTGPDSSSFTVTPAAANKLVFGQQPTTTIAGAAVTPAVTVLIEDPFGNLVSSDNTDQVTLGIASGPGLFSGASTTTVTASGGSATFSNLHLNTAGTYTLSDAASGGLSGPASSSFDVTAGAVNRLAVTAFPSTVTAGTGLGLTVTALDLYGNPTIDSGIVTFTSNDPLMLSPVSFLTTFSGDTAFAVATLKTATGTGWTVMVSDSTSHSGSSNAVPVTPAAANQLVFGQQPTNTTAGLAIAPAVTVKIEDQFGNLLTSDNTDAVTVGVASGPGSFTGASSATVTASGGSATFANLHLNTAGTYTLRETAGGGISGLNSNSFTVTPATANQLVFGVQPSNTTAGAAIAPAVTVKIEDPFGNVVTSDNTDTVTVGIASGPGSFTVASTTTLTASSGVATFSNLHLNTAGTYTLSETASSSLSGPASNSFTVTPSTANQLVFGVQPTNTTAGAAITPAVTVKIEDQFGNLVSTDSTDTVTIGVASGPGTFANTSTLTITANTGVATFTNLRLNTAGSYTLSETASSSLSGPASNSFTVTPTTINQVGFGQQPTNTTAGAAISPAVTVKLEDQFGNVVTTDNTDTVTVGVASGPGSFSGSTTILTASAGSATFSNLHLNTAGSYTLSETASGSLAGPSSSSFTVIPATPNQLAFGQQPSNTASGNPITPAVTVKIEDQFGNVVTSDSSDHVTVAVATGPGAATIVSGTGGATQSGNTVTITTTAGTGYTTGQTVVIAGVTVSGYNGAFTITSVPTATTFTYTDPTSGLANSGGGTATVTPLFNAGSTTSVTASAGLATFSNLALGSAGSYTLSASATGSLSGPASNSFNVTFVVVSGGFVATPTGFTVTFSQAFNPATLNLTGPTGPVAVTLVGSGNIGPISGSLYLDPTDTKLTFVKTVVVGVNGLPVSSGSLPLGTYTVTLVSGSTALTTTNGQTLDGNSDGVAGDNYTATFHVVSSSPAAGDVLLPSAAVLATAPDFARGPLTPNVTIASSNGATESGNTVTITTTLAHGFSMGQTVMIAGVGLGGYNGTFTITTVPSSPNLSGSPTTFTYTDPTSGLTPSGSGTANVPAVNVANNSGNGIPIDLTVLAPVQTVTFSSGITTGTTGTFKLGFNSQTTANITVGTAIKATTGSAGTSGASESGTTVTIRTATATGLKVGESVTINGVGIAGYNGTFTVATTPSTTSFTYTAASGLTLSGGGTWNLNGGASLATAIQAGLGALSVVGGTANVAVTGTGPFTVTFATAVANPNLMSLAANAISSAPTITIVNPNAPASVTDATLVLGYNANLLTITPGAVNASLSVAISGSGTAAQATITYHNAGGVNLGTLGSVDLGGLNATVPSTAPYKAKMLLHFVSESINGGALTAAGVDGYQLVAYQGDTDGNGSYSGNDQTLLNAVAGGSSPGFAAYRQIDPVIIGGLSGGTSVSATDSGLMASYLNGVAIPQVPDQTGVTPTLFAPGPDPMVSIPSSLSVAADGTVVVPVNLDDARPAGSTGLTQAELALTYDPSLFTVRAADVHLGTIPSSGSGWTLSTVVDAVTGQLAITLLSQTPIATAIGGSLVTIDFHRTGTALSGTTAIDLAASVDPNGQGRFVTALFDTDNRFVLGPAPANGPADPVSGWAVLTSAAPVPPTAVVRVVEAAPTARPVAGGLLSSSGSAEVVDVGTPVALAGPAAPVEMVAEDEAAAGAAPVADAAPARMARTVAHPAAVDGMAVVASSSVVSAASPAAGLVFQFGNTPSLSVAGAQHLADQWFLALGRGTADLADRALLVCTLEETSSWGVPGVRGGSAAATDDSDGQLWEGAGSDLDWLPPASAGPLARRTPSANRPSEVMVPAVATQQAALDRYFADMADDTTDPFMDSDE